MDYQSFVNKDKVLLIAPAGYGKTHTIVESIKYTDGKQLILTHTHAGVASIKEKIKKAGITSSRYNVETISSFAQKYVNAFYMGTDIPNQENPKDYHPFIISKAAVLLKAGIVKNVLKATYAGLFVDEYQDCTKLQHEMILALSDVLQTRILGDPLQGIFDFNGDLVDFDADLSEFERLPELSIPYRWYQEGNNKFIGDLVKGYREQIKNKAPISVTMRPKFDLYYFQVNEGDFDNPKSEYREKLGSLIRNEKGIPDLDSLLIIVPEYYDLANNIRKGGVSDRAKILTKIDYSRSVVLLEAIDEQKFYYLANEFDNYVNAVKKAIKPVKNLHTLLSSLFYKTSPNKCNFGLNDWISTKPKTKNGDYYVIDKRLEAGVLANRLRTLIENIISNPSQQGIYSLLLYVKNDLKIRVQPRRELLGSLIKALNHSANENITVYEAMKAHKNTVRRAGRKVHGKCIGTTLLTKGLEFDTVAILDAEKIDCPKHLYVALTRCCKKLIIFSSKETLSPYS